MQADTLSTAERLDRLRLCRTDNVGPVTYRRLIERFGSAAAAIDALPDLSRRGGRSRALVPPRRTAAEQEAEALVSRGGHLVFWGEAAYPVPLAAIEDAPPVLSVLGRGELLHERVVAIVGARNASANGCRFARGLAADLADAGWIVVSGLARGIDADGHQGALKGGTVAVVAGGVDVIYPKENAELYDRIAERGAVVSEQPLGTKPQARHFPPRNRIISGLALGVVVVEAAMRSGSLITARLAGEQGREVFAVPGSPMDPRCRGTNGLIRQGATLTESAADVLEALDGMVRPLVSGRLDDHMPTQPAWDEPAEADVASARQAVHDKLGYSPIHVDELMRQCQLSPALLSAALLELELAGRLARHPGNQVSLR